MVGIHLTGAILMINRTIRSVGRFLSPMAYLAILGCGAITALPAAAQDRNANAPLGLGSGANRAAIIGSEGLNNPMLKLTTGQRADIDKVIYAFMAEQRKLDESLPIARNKPVSQEAIRARQDARANLTAALAAVMTDEQRKTLVAEQAKRHPNANPAQIDPAVAPLPKGK